ncbi:MAG: caspase family protein [Deltaproteobacteria bacterium]|nr:caspase family protein [Deltaproteobacteria bacterium]
MWPLLLSSVALSAPTLPSIDQGLRSGATAPADAAVVIGLEDYAFVADVPFAHRDAQAFYEYLIYTRGVPSDHVRLLLSGGREQLLAALEQAAAEVGAGGTLWVYFAGHGAAATASGERILLGDDVRQDPTAFESRALSLSEIRGRAAGRRLALFTDACYSGLGRSGEELVSGKRFAVPVRATTPQAETLEWTAAAGDQLSGPLDPAQHGAFTYFMIGALRGWADGQLSGAPDGVVTAEEADLYVRSALKTVQIADQTPELSVSGASSWVLSEGRLEAAPSLSPVSTSGTKTVTVGADQLLASDYSAMTARLQALVDRCVSESPSAAFPNIQWYIQFKVKDGVQKTIILNGSVPVIGTAMTVPATTLDPTVFAQYSCLRQQIKALQFAPEGSVKVVRTLTHSSYSAF